MCFETQISVLWKGGFAFSNTNKLLKTQIGYGWKHKLISQNTNFKKENLPFVHTNESAFVKHKFAFSKHRFVITKSGYVFYYKTQICLFEICVLLGQICVFKKKIICVLSNLCFENRSNSKRHICVSTKSKFVF